MAIDAAKRASHFNVIIRRGREAGRFRVPVKTLALARFAGAVLEEKIGNGTLSMVYAMTPDGNGFFIKRELDARILQA